MASSNETGHAKNVASFNELIIFAERLGVKYNPSAQAITLTGLREVLANAKQTMKDLSISKSAMDNAINERAEAFEPLQQLSTRIVAAYSTVSTVAGLKDLKAYQRKIYGWRAGKKGKDTPPPAIDGEQQPEPTDNSISVSQRSYDNLLDHFDKMIDVLKSNEKYKPNEEELSVEGLTDKLKELEIVNSKAAATATEWHNARINRGEVMYAPFTGLTDIARKVKEYVKSVYKANSPQYKQVNNIPFRSRKG